MFRQKGKVYIYLLIKGREYGIFACGNMYRDNMYFYTYRMTILAMIYIYIYIYISIIR